MASLTLHPRDFAGGPLGKRPSKLVKRVFHSKTRTGCNLCRQRHIRCDEQMPCLRCRKANLICPGPRSLPRSHLVDLSHDELRSLQHFRERTSESLAGSYDSDFWASAVMRLSYSSEALQHFVVAISSLDETFRSRASGSIPPDVSHHQYVFSLREYSKAIEKVVVESRDDPGSITVLAAAIFCSFFELWLGDMLEAQKHAMAALNLLPCQSSTERSEMQSLLDTQFRPTLIRICSQFRGGFSRPSNRHNSPAAFDSVSQASLSDYAMAKVRLECLTTFLFEQAEAFSQSRDHNNDGLQKHIEELLVHLETWYSELERFDSRISTSRSTAHRQQRQLLEIRYRYFRVNLAVLPFHDEMFYDKFLEDFRNIVQSCEDVLKHTASHNPGTHRSAEMTPIMALSFVGLSCRDPTMRRQAIRLLYRYRRQEGVWSSIACGILAEHVMMLEEDGSSKVKACSDIPAARRVRPFSAMYDSGRPSNLNRPRFVYRHLRPHLNANTLHERIVLFEQHPVYQDYGIESVVWFPNDPPAPLLESEIAASTRNRDAPLMREMDSWTVFINHDLEKASRMVLMELSFDDDAGPAMDDFVFVTSELPDPSSTI